MTVCPLQEEEDQPFRCHHANAACYPHVPLGVLVVPSCGACADDSVDATDRTAS